MKKLLERNTGFLMVLIFGIIMLEFFTMVWIHELAHVIMCIIYEIPFRINLNLFQPSVSLFFTRPNMSHVIIIAMSGSITNSIYCLLLVIFIGKKRNLWLDVAPLFFLLLEIYYWITGIYHQDGDPGILFELHHLFDLNLTTVVDSIVFMVEIIILIFIVGVTVSVCNMIEAIQRYRQKKERNIITLEPYANIPYIN